MAGKIIKRKDMSSLSIADQSQISNLKKVQVDEFDDEFQDRYPIGELLLREEQI